MHAFPCFKQLLQKSHLYSCLSIYNHLEINVNVRSLCVHFLCISAVPEAINPINHCNQTKTNNAKFKIANIQSKLFTFTILPLKSEIKSEELMN